MKNSVFLIIPLVVMICFSSCTKKREGNPRVLVFAKTAAFTHPSIPTGIAAVLQLGSENGFDVDTTRNAAYFHEDSLKKYSAVIFLSTTGNVLDYRQEVAFERYIQSGGGFVGIHAATDTEYDWRWYGKLVGGYFAGHPPTQEARFVIKDFDFPATEFFEDSAWVRTDEIYNFKHFNSDVNVLITVDETSYEGGAHGDEEHPMAWYHEYDGGRAFYTGMGHTHESWSEENFLKHLLGGIRYAIGKNLELDYRKAKSQYPPDEDRFTKEQLTYGNLFEPTEMTILPNLDILIVQRRGEVMLYKNETQQMKQVGHLDVYWKTSVPKVNAEEGVMGIARDPNFADNNWIYIFYSPIDSSVNRLSRFTFRNDTLDLATEKVILDVPSQRQICCHTGGSIAFDSDGLLYLSTGDNSTPFNEPDAPYVNHGFAPLNDLPGKEQYDARRSAGNTNDLRGKILRIRVNDDATYDIPPGNLFPPGTENTRPEIYVMGNRNPYRIAIDQKNSFLYWGEVGPDAHNDSMATRGPRGYDEVNQAREAGNFGWPLFIADNIPYRDYDYATGESGELFDPHNPINDSKNNTGLLELPPPVPALIWYPYAQSNDFPQLGSGGRNAMAGPVYYTDMFPKETRLPDYYNGKLFIYDWIRGWIKAVTLFPNGDYNKMEPFFPQLKVNSLIDMEVGPDGRLYLLEYGSGWFSKNTDSGLARIDFNGGNRPPKILAFDVDRTSGILPFRVTATVEATDPENDEMTYVWNLGNDITQETKVPRLDYTYNTVGDFRISVEVKDDKGAVAKSEPIPIYAGNEAPHVVIELTGGNRSFFLAGEPIAYRVVVTDNDTAKFDPANLFVSVEYATGGYDKAESTMGHQEGEIGIIGKGLVMSLDCKSCHKETEKSIGPSYLQVAQKYDDNVENRNYLASRIINGSQGVWGETAMPAHPNLPEADAHRIVSWILSLGKDDREVAQSLPPSGTITPPRDANPKSFLVVSATYTDKGGNNVKALTSSASLALPGSLVSVAGDEEVKGFRHMTFRNTNILVLPEAEGWFALDSIDLTGVRGVEIQTGWQEPPSAGIAFEVRLDAPAGRLLGRGWMPVPSAGQRTGTVSLRLNSITDGQFHKVYFICKPESEGTGRRAGVTGVTFTAR